MVFTFRLHSSSRKRETTPPPPQTYPRIVANPYCHLDSWHIKRHDRDKLIEEVMPYMAGSLREKHLLHVFFDRHIWAAEFVGAEAERNTKPHSASFSRVTTSFWRDQVTTIAELFRLTRLLFFTLLRYYYRIQFFEGRETASRDLDVPHLGISRDERYIKALEENEVHRLERRYGSSFYRCCYRGVKKCAEWTSFCDRVRDFCQSLGLHTLSDDPEVNLRDLRHNLCTIISHQRMQDLSSQVAETTALVREARSDIDRVDTRATSSVTHNDDVVVEMKQEIEQLKQEIREMRHRHQELPPTPPLLDDSLQRHMEIGTSLPDLQMIHQDRLDELSRSTVDSEQLIQTLRNEVDEMRIEMERLRLHGEKNTAADKINKCRGLLEQLPPGKSKFGQNSSRWKGFWETEWAKKKKKKTHPLWVLGGDAKYEEIGSRLYKTLSTILHEYNVQGSKPLDPDVERVVNAVGPIFFHKDGSVNLEEERKRWSN